MSRPSIQQAVERNRQPEPPTATPSVATELAASPKRQQPAGRGGKLNVSAYFPREVKSSLRLVQAKRGGKVQDLLAEALNLLFAKYGVPETAPVGERD